MLEFCVINIPYFHSTLNAEVSVMKLIVLPSKSRSKASEQVGHEWLETILCINNIN